MNDDAVPSLAIEGLGDLEDGIAAGLLADDFDAGQEEAGPSLAILKREKADDHGHGGEKDRPHDAGAPGEGCEP
jgi:hypothetical protein